MKYSRTIGIKTIYSQSKCSLENQIVSQELPKVKKAEKIAKMEQFNLIS